MQFNNRLIEVEQPDTEVETVAFHTLNEGSRYQHAIDGPVSRVIRKEFDFMTIERADGWLITNLCGDWIWDKAVIRL